MLRNLPTLYSKDTRYVIDAIQALARRARRTATGDVIDEPTLFLHVPKCGGTSIKAALKQAYGLRSGLKIDLRGNFHHDFFQIGLHASKEAADRLGMPPRELREHVLLYHMSSPGKKLISGHFQFSDVAYQEYHDRYTFITLIRDPVERWYSHYFYDRDKEGGHFAVDDAINEYLRSPRGRSTGSLIARYFASSDCSEEEVVDSAISNIAKFDVVGVLEDLGAFQRDLRHVLGASINVPIRNTSPTPSAQKRDEITPQIHRRVVEVCRPDQMVYDYVMENLIGTQKDV